MANQLQHLLTQQLTFVRSNSAPFGVAFHLRTAQVAGHSWQWVTCCFVGMGLVLLSVLSTLPVHAQSTATPPVQIDQTQNMKAMGYTDSRKIVRDSQGNLYVVYRKKYKLHQTTAYHIFAAKSTDEGVQWTVLNDGKPIETVGDFNQRVAAIAIDSHDVLHVVWYGPDVSTQHEDENQIKYVRSTDGGKSWSTWRNISVVRGYLDQSLWQEHPTIFIDRRNQIYIVWEGRDGWYSNVAQIKFIQSTDGGLSWRDWVNIAPSDYSRSRPTLVAADNLYVFAYGSRNGLQQILYSVSTDGGVSWSRWRQIAASTQDQRHVSAAVDSVGHVHIVWRQLPFAAVQQQDTSAQVYYASFDGTTWSSPVRIAPHFGIAQTYPSIAVDREQTVWITWLETTDPYEFPKDAPTTGTVYYVAKTVDGWSNPVRYAAGANNLYPSLRRDLTSRRAIDVVWLEALPSTNLIRFSQLTRPTHFAPALLANEGVQTASFFSTQLAWFWESKPLSAQSITSNRLQSPGQFLRDLRAVMMLIIVVSIYVTAKFLIQRWFALPIR